MDAIDNRANQKIALVFLIEMQRSAQTRTGLEVVLFTKIKKKMLQILQRSNSTDCLIKSGNNHGTWNTGKNLEINGVVC